MKDISDNGEGLSLPGVYGQVKNFPFEPKILIPSNVKYADVIFRQSTTYEPIFDFSTASITNFSGIGSSNSSRNKILDDNILKLIGSFSIPHSSVHQWYRATILPEDKFYDQSGYSQWFLGYKNSRKEEGYNYSRIGGNLTQLPDVKNGISITEMNQRIFNRTGFKINTVFNHNFQYGLYGWFDYGGKISLLQSINNRLVFQKSNPNDPKLVSFIPTVKHNYMYFGEDDDFLGIQVINRNTSSKINIEFYLPSGEVGQITLPTPEAKTYFVKVPDVLKKNVGTFSISLDKTTNYNPLVISRVYLSKSEIPDGEIAKLEWRNNEQTLSPSTLGVVADGTSRLLISIGNEMESSVLNINRSTKVLVNIKDQDGSLNTSKYIGSLKSITNLNQLLNPMEVSHTGEIVAVGSTKLNNQYYFDYQAPIDFSRDYEGMDDSYKSEREVGLEITLLDGANEIIGVYKKIISIVRPPLILAHGLGGEGSNGKSTWRNFRYASKDGKEVLFKDSNLFLAKRDINLLPTASFDANSDVLLGKSTEPNMENESFDAMIKRMNDMGYACAKVDYVAHSMGGSVLRNTIDKPEYKNSKNYNQGYVNKFITICTPHQGSPLGDIVNEFTPYIQKIDPGNKSLLAGLNLELKYWSKNPDNSYSASDAIKNLALNTGVKFNEQNVFNHTIAASFTESFENSIVALSAMEDQNPKEGWGLGRLTQVLAKSAKEKFKTCDCKTELNEIEAILSSTDGNLSKLIYDFFTWANKRYSKNPTFLENSDLIVSVESQTNGRLKASASKSNLISENSYSFINDVTHNFNPKATQSIEIGNRVLELLNKPVNSKYFNSFLYSTKKELNSISCNNDCSTFSVKNLNFTFSPNPTQNDFELDLTEMGDSKGYQINIYDEKGNLMHTQTLNNNCCPTISPAIKRPGVYSVNIMTDHGVKTKKIIINK
jgi:hypothetical protein